MNAKVDSYIKEAGSWQEEMKELRAIILRLGLVEELKWGVPCYTFQENNILLISAFKKYCVISFFKGALIKDSHKLLQKPGANTQAARVIRFSHIKEISDHETLLEKYINEAIEVEKAGLKVDFKKNALPVIPEEFQKKMNEISGLKTAFETLTPGRQRAYLLYFSSPKQSKTRGDRVEKYIRQILNGQGINDCTCGLSGKMPYCDGSHKYA